MRSLRSLIALLVAALTLAALGPALAKKPIDAATAVGDDGSAAVADHAAGFLSGDDERITSFDSDIVIDADATLHVTETIRVRSAGINISHGITRDFPTRYRNAQGRTVRVGFHVEGVTRDGAEESWTTERIDNGTRVRIGRAETTLENGEHVYVVRYTTTRQIGYFPDHDELYWNVTGTGWAFPIDQASVHIRLPRPVQLSQPTIYTGAQGERGQDAEIVSQGPGEISFRTTRPLGDHQGLTVAVAWPKGVVAEPPPPSALRQFFTDDGPIGAALIGLLGLCGFYYVAWKKAGRGPVAGTIVPLFQPPPDMSAAAIRYVKDMGYDNRCFTAAIVESGVKGKLRLVETDPGGFFSSKKTRIDKTADGDDLGPPERDMLRGLFSRGDSVAAEQAQHESFQAAQTGLQNALASAYKGKLFLSNLGWAFIGLMVLAIAMILVGAIIILADPDSTTGARAVPLIGLAILAGGLALSPRSSLLEKGGSGLFAALCVTAFLAGVVLIVITIVKAADSGNIAFIFAPLLALPLVISAFWWMAAPTRAGRDIMDKIAGFEMYLSATEENRLNVLHPPEKTPELFERLLPYAIALGVENQWASRFAAVLAAASQTPGQQSGMAWYVGSQSPWTNINGFTTAVGGALTSSVAAASVAPGSSSGTGGGGFSGGGGGGGGGGGW